MRDHEEFKDILPAKECDQQGGADIKAFEHVNYCLAVRKA